MAFLSPQSTMSHFISLKQAKSCLCQIFGKEKINLWHWIRKVMILSWVKIIYLFGLRNNRKGDWKRENIFWNKLGQLAYTGRVRYATGRVQYEWGYKTERTPSAQIDLSSPNQPSRHPSSSPRATEDFTK